MKSIPEARQSRSASLARSIAVVRVMKSNVHIASLVRSKAVGNSYFGHPFPSCPASPGAGGKVERYPLKGERDPPSQTTCFYR